MSANTSIEWCDSTFNPWIGCTKVSRETTGGGGCDGCYAEMSTPARVLRSNGRETWGPGAPRVRTKTWGDPVKWSKQPFFECQACGRRGTQAELEATDERECDCHKYLTPARQRVFCASLADVFDNEVDPMWRVDLFWLIKQTPNLDWLLLTKRIGNARTMMADAIATIDPMAEWVMPLPNIWLGATVVNQIEADRDIPKLLAVPAAKRFLSMEPLLGQVDLERWLEPAGLDTDLGLSNPGIDWVIVGSESGPKARPGHIDWTRGIVQQCRAAGVPAFVKQLGREVFDSGMSSPGEHWPSGTIRQPLRRVHESDPPFVIRLNQTKGNDSGEWPEDLRVKEFPK